MAEGQLADGRPFQRSVGDAVDHESRTDPGRCLRGNRVRTRSALRRAELVPRSATSSVFSIDISGIHLIGLVAVPPSGRGCRDLFGGQMWKVSFIAVAQSRLPLAGWPPYKSRTNSCLRRLAPLCSVSEAWSAPAYSQRRDVTELVVVAQGSRRRGSDILRERHWPPQDSLRSSASRLHQLG